jgi:hypothetical protein
MTNQITTEELAALQAFAAESGRCWKRDLMNTYWYNARIWRDADGSTFHGSVLHGLRNRLGASWLVGFKLPTTQTEG